MRTTSLSSAAVKSWSLINQLGSGDKGVSLYDPTEPRQDLATGPFFRRRLDISPHTGWEARNVSPNFSESVEAISGGHQLSRRIDSYLGRLGLILRNRDVEPPQLREKERCPASDSCKDIVAGLVVVWIGL
jgi:hypothetical protein